MAANLMAAIFFNKSINNLKSIKMKKSILIAFAAFGINAAIAQTTDTAGNYNGSQATRTQAVTSSSTQTVSPGTHGNRKSSANGNYNSDGNYNGNNTNNSSTSGSTTKNTNGTKRSSTTKSTSTYTTTGPSK